MDAESVEEVVIRLVAMQLDLDPGSVETESNLSDDLEADPYDLEEIGNLLAEEYEITVGEDDVEGWETVGDIVQFVLERLESDGDEDDEDDDE
ncbi:MAG: acyl carrier protein [Deltaproteobacteria bacterium]|nr:acyl carrier protein [bacterium]MCB9476514.1 acyl carrier protein [Deltaproteobacteria bacterium]MCB9478937.1 acyl carrier protein [Deltaproteobacteria bacterium]MCB9489441.1 acyl carrier protein [Deltaproteobacteria bacterium]